MEKEIDEYTKAVKAHITAVQKETQSKLEVKKTRTALLLAKDSLRAREMELLYNQDE
jgi:hypothetical protein